MFSDLLYDPDFEDNLDKTFKDLNLINGQFLTVSDTDDETGDKVNVVLFIVSS